ncbi:FmdE family protein [endosymbiont of Ridgeia piscesae]|jgi:formylmethanofuran dehydrogenase subunit E|uniref:FmdE, Molybdenum formylmethanofuran dehydrogenase operon n=1 Tax=endosymbiont of Ridgeia piscesae TaxID=54398 RepID=A0A0T5Z111_9GAMM|nr:FmdE family protein [endosymbiont of Ridgeia piscesae]KRT56149.1 hypothetical protein Ga0074115_13228 [endosymbiont of Ridgeia piscesae]KRT56855.1 FmdE, Molybdenum formylmethanofuran dehydrogenase operon [endosymbiont of Ridgeia piscesae]
MNTMFPQEPSLHFFDPLAELLGAGDGHFTYTFDDAVKLSGHACPTVAGAFLMVVHAMDALYGSETPQRGDILIRIQGAQDQGVLGPISQVFTLLTGAAPENGFQGLGGQHARNGLLRFEPAYGDAAGPFTFERGDTGKRVTVSYDPSCIPPRPEMGAHLQQILQGSAEAETKEAFRSAWRERVLNILADGGQSTVAVTVTREPT